MRGAITFLHIVSEASQEKRRGALPQGKGSIAVESHRSPALTRTGGSLFRPRSTAPQALRSAPEFNVKVRGVVGAGAHLAAGPPHAAASERWGVSNRTQFAPGSVRREFLDAEAPSI